MGKKSQTKIGKLAKNRGSLYELEIAKGLFDQLGIKFQRVLEQVRTSGLGDLECDEPSWPFAIECKRRKKGNHIPIGAWQQALQASDAKNGIYPAVLYRYDNRPTRVCVSYASIVEAETGKPSENIHDRCEISFDRFCKLTREILAWRAET